MTQQKPRRDDVAVTLPRMRQERMSRLISIGGEIDSPFYSHGPACPGHPNPQTAGSGGSDKPGHDGRGRPPPGVKYRLRNAVWSLRFGIIAAVLLWGLSVADAHAAGLVFVVNSTSASISVIDMSARKELRRIPALREPHHLVLS